MRTKDPDLRRDDILQAALTLFRELGFEKTSVESIAKGAGIAKGSFYTYFSTKEQVYEAIVSSIAEKTLSAAKEILAQKNVSPKACLKQYIEWTYQLSERQEQGLTRVLSPEANASQRKIYLAALDEGNRQMLPLFVDLLQAGINKGEFMESNTAYTATFLLGAFRGIHVAFHNQLDISMDESKIYLYDLLSRLLGADFTS